MIVRRLPPLHIPPQNVRLVLLGHHFFADPQRLVDILQYLRVVGFSFGFHILVLVGLELLHQVLRYLGVVLFALADHVCVDRFLETDRAGDFFDLRLAQHHVQDAVDEALDFLQVLFVLDQPFQLQPDLDEELEQGLPVDLDARADLLALPMEAQTHEERRQVEQHPLGHLPEVQQVVVGDVVDQTALLHDFLEARLVHGSFLQNAENQAHLFLLEGRVPPLPESLNVGDAQLDQPLADRGQVEFRVRDVVPADLEEAHRLHQLQPLNGSDQPGMFLRFQGQEIRVHVLGHHLALHPRSPAGEDAVVELVEQCAHFLLLPALGHCLQLSFEGFEVEGRDGSIFDDAEFTERVGFVQLHAELWEGVVGQPA